MRNRTLLVTGGCGFIGSNFIHHILETKKDWSVVNIDALTYAGNPDNLSDLQHESRSRYEFVHADIRHLDAVLSVFDSHRIDAVVHFAAESHVDKSIHNPAAFIETNVIGTYNLLEASRKYWEKMNMFDTFRFLHVSTDEVYGSLGLDGYFTETTAYDPSSPYSASKAGSDHLVNAWYRTYGLPTLITNCSNNYGPYQFPEKLIPLIILSIQEEKTLPVYGDGKNVRDWLYVIDHCDALLTALEKGTPGHTYNIGGGEEWQNIDIVYRICEKMDSLLGRTGDKSSRNLVRFVADRPGHDRRYAIDASKINNELGWQSKHTFEDALDETIQWYMSNEEWVTKVRTGEYRDWIEKNYTNRMSVE